MKKNTWGRNHRLDVIAQPIYFEYRYEPRRPYIMRDDDVVKTKGLSYRLWRQNLMIFCLAVGIAYPQAQTHAAEQPPSATRSASGGSALSPKTDSDGDGVIDAQDLCPHTPKGKPVDPQTGCPIYSQPASTVKATGFVDATETQAPQEQASAPLTPKTTPTTTTITTLGADLLFDFGESYLSPRASFEMNKIAQQLAAQSQAKAIKAIHVYGHSDRIGSTHRKSIRSQQRAQAVREYLLQAGVPAALVTAEGRADAEPVVWCREQSLQALLACLAPNRRIVLEIIR